VRKTESQKTENSYGYVPAYNPVLMRVILAAFAGCLFAVLAFSQDKTVPVAEEGHHQMVLENEYTRVFHVVVPPKESTLVHQHDRDYVWVQIGSADLSNARVGSAAADVKLADGEVKFAKGGFAHKVTDVGDTPFVNVTIEVKKASTKAIYGASWAEVKPEKPEGGLISIAGPGGQIANLATDAVEAHTYFTTGSGTGVTPGDADNPRLLVAVSALRCACGGPQDKEMKSGDVTWVAKGTAAKVSKTDSKGARFVMVSFK